MSIFLNVALSIFLAVWPDNPGVVQQVAQPPSIPTDVTNPTREMFGALGSHRLTVPAERLDTLLVAGLADPSPRLRESALLALAGRAGMLMSTTPEHLATWQAERPVLQSLRGQVRIALEDSDERVRNAALLAFASLSYRLEGNRLSPTLDDDALQTLTVAYRRETSAFNRGEIVKAVALCPCPPSAGRRTLLQEALDDSSAGVLNFAINGAAGIHMLEVLPRVVELLTHTTRSVRLAAATAVGRYCSDAIAYAPRLRELLVNEHDSVIRGVLEGSLKSVTTK